MVGSSDRGKNSKAMQFYLVYILFTQYLLYKGYEATPINLNYLILCCNPLTLFVKKYANIYMALLCRFIYTKLWKRWIGASQGFNVILYKWENVQYAYSTFLRLWLKVLKISQGFGSGCFTAVRRSHFWHHVMTGW
jgi:hypothetical protein